MSYCPPELIVDRHCEIFGHGTLESFCALFESGAIIERINDGCLICRGIDEIRDRYSAHFLQSPRRRYKVLSRTSFGEFVVDHEAIDTPEQGGFEALVIYQVAADRIRSVRYALADVPEAVGA